MTDVGSTIAPKSDQLNADDLISGPITIRVTGVSASPSSPEQPININFDGDRGKPYKPCKSMRRVLVHMWGRDGSLYVGRSMTLYRDPDVQFGGIKVGGIRISHLSHIEEAMTMALTNTRASRKPYTVKPLSQEPDRVTDGVNALIERIDAADPADLDAILDEMAVKTQRTWLTDNRAALSDRLEAVIDEKRAQGQIAGDGGAPAADDNPFGEPSTDQPANTDDAPQTGGGDDSAGPDPDRAKLELEKAEDYLERAKKVGTIIDLKKLENEAQPHIDAFLDEDLAGACNGALKDARARLTAKK